MTAWTFETICAGAGGTWVVAPGADTAAPIGAAIDSREVKPGMLFVAFKGERVDGHRYLEQADGAGAAMAIATDADAVPDSIGMPVLLVEDATEALDRIASLWRGLLGDLRVVGVTGSNGKTTTCRLLHAAACLGGEGSLPGTRTRKSYNNAIGVPLTVLNARAGDRVLVCEIGMSTPGEIAARCRTAQPEAAIITGVSGAHLEGLGSLEAIAREKASIAAGLADGAPLFMPGGIGVLDDAVAALANQPRVVRVGPGMDHEMSVISATGGGTRFILDGREYEIPLVGEHNAMNAALAVLAARHLGAGDDAIARGLAATEAPAMRLERSVIATDPPIVVINDAYNANPASMRAALDVLCAETGGRRVAVLGDMLELGAAGEQAHADMFEYAKGHADAVLTIGPRFAVAGSGGEPGTDSVAIERLADRIRPGDTVLLKGSRGMRLERVLDVLRARMDAADEPKRSAVNG